MHEVCGEWNRHVWYWSVIHEIAAMANINFQTQNTIDTKLFWWFEAKCRQPKWDGERRRVYCENKTESPTKLVGWERMRCTVKTFTAYGNFMWIVFFFVNVSLVAVRELLFVFPSLLLTVCRMSPMCWLRNPHWALQFDWIDAFNAAAQNPTYTSKSLASWWTNEYIYLPMLFDIFEYFFMPFFLQLIHSECT